MRPPLNVVNVIFWLSCFLPQQHSAGENPLFYGLDGNPKVTYQDALTRCQNRLPDDQTAHDDLVEFMRRSGIWRAWIGWRRSTDRWTWITGQAVEKSSLLEDGGHDFGMMEHDGRLEGRPSHHTLPVICQFNGVPCSQTYAAAYCASSNKTTLLVAPALQGWYTARAFCRHLSGDLATFQHKQDKALAKGLMKKLPGWPFWIGARRYQWKTPQKQAELNDMWTNQWEADQPGAGDCVVIQRTGGRGFWRSADCGSLNSVICATPNYRKTTPVLPRQNTTARALADISIYPGSKKDNLTVEQLCESQNTKSLTNDELINSTDIIAQYMKTIQISSAWLPWERRILLNWTWLGGDVYSGKVMEDKAPLCATPDRIFGPSSLYVIPCHGKYVGYICQFTERKPCWRTHHSYNCFHLGSTTLVVGIRIQSWYVASALCTALGGQLAQLPEEWMIRTFLNFHKQQRTLQTTDFFYVGIQKGVWQTDKNEPLAAQNMWGVRSPLSNESCSVMQLEEDSLLWRSADCTETHAVLCRAPPRTTVAATQETQTLYKQVENMTFVLNGTYFAGESRHESPILIAVGIAVLAVVITGVAVLILICKCKIGRRRKNRQRYFREPRFREEGDEEYCAESSLLHSRGKKPDEDHTEPFPLLILPKRNVKMPHQSGTEGISTGNIRESGADLHPERLDAIFKNVEFLKEKILIESSGLLEKLVKADVLTEENLHFIKKSSTNRQQVERLLDIVVKKNNKNYEKMCDCLWTDKQSDVVTAFLTTPVDLLTAREKVIKYIESEFKDIHMYTADNASHPVPLDKIYVNVTWERVDNHSSSRRKDTKEHTYLKSHLDIFRKMQIYGDTRTTISGIAGSGKTSFVKHISQKWIDAHRKPFTTSDVSPLKFYIILVPIFLRLIRADMSLTDVIKDQIPSISFLEAYSICRAMSLLQSNVLVILDGYDELVAHNMIDPIIRKVEHAQVSILVTTRPHGITLLKSLGSGSLEQLLYIYGFNKDQIKTYIKFFFDLPGQTAEKGTQLMKELVAKENYLSEMARVPIQLEIMCLVWSVKEKLGNNILDLYQNFIECLEFHMKTKGDIKCNPEEILSCLGTLANSWTKYGSLEKIFSHETLSTEFEEKLEGMIKFGCLVKYHPSTDLGTSYWSFSHLTLQEYFLALDICRQSLNEKELVKGFSTLSKLERLDIVLKFICGMSPSIGNEILQAVIMNTTDKEECKRLLNLIQKLVPEYKSSDEINLPLPRYVAINKIDSVTKRKTLRVLSRSDRRPEHRNMKHLSLSAEAIRNLSEHKQVLDISYVHTLELQTGNKQKKGKEYYSYIFNTAKMVQKLDITGVDDRFPSSALSNVTSAALTEMWLQGQYVIYKASEFLDKAKVLEVLHLEETGKVEEIELQKLCTKLNEGDGIKMLHLTIQSLHPALLSLQPTVKVTVGRLTKESLAVFVGGIKESNHGIANITELKIRDIADDDTDEDGRQGLMLGQLLCYFTQLLHLTLSGIENVDILLDEVIFLNMAGLVQVVNDNNRTLSLRCLSLRRIDLLGAGAAVGQLVSRCPHLHTLELVYCMLKVEDVEQMAENVPGSTSITRLSLGNKLEGGETAVCRLLQHTPNIQQLDVYFCRLHIPSLLQATGPDTLTNLRLLELRRNTDEQLEVSSYLASMPRLQALSVEYCHCTSVPALLHLIENLPPALTHLNVCDNDFSTAVVEVTTLKEKLAQLHRLNIGTGDQKDEVEAIREELQQVNPDMRVYCDYGERLWTMYKDSQADEEHTG